MRFWKVDPLSDSESVFWRDSGVLTGAEGSIQPAPVPADAGGEKTLSDDDVVVVVDLVEVSVVKAEDWLRRMVEKARESFMVSVAVLYL